MRIGEQPEMKQLTERREERGHFEAPIVDIIRHGETIYKELADPNFKFDPDAPDFDLDPEHLDLTLEGIRNIHDTAERLASGVDKEKEAVLFVVSPQFRAISSALIVEKVFSEHGIMMLNSTIGKESSMSKGIKTSPLGLGQIPLHEKLKGEGFGKTWLEAHKQYGEEHSEAKNKPPVEIHGAVAASLGVELSEIFSKSHEDMDIGFKRFLRHAMNIEKYLRDDTKQLLDGKKLRIVSVTHEERIMEFAQESLALDKTVAKGQLLEIKPQGFLKKDGEIDAEINLYGKEGESDLSADIKMKFSQEGLSVNPRY